MRTLLHRISGWALALVVLGCALAACEAVVRALYREQTVLFPRYHTAYQYGPYTLRGQRPNMAYHHTSVEGRWRFVTNSRGLRSEREFAYDKPADLLRVLAIGDSQTQGYEVAQESTYAAVLERLLHGHGRRAEVLNAGVSGFGNAEAAAYLEHEGLRYQPDVVVLGFFGNDFADNYAAPLFALEGQGALVARGYAHVPGVKAQDLLYSVPGTRWLGEHSYLYSLLFNGVWQFYKDQMQRSNREFAVPNSLQHNDAEVRLAVALIERMKRLCDARGVRFIVLDLPERTGPFHFRSSMPAHMRAHLAAASIELVEAERLLGRFNGAAAVHRAHGNLHMTELAHAAYGAELGARILNKDTSSSVSAGAL